MRKLVFDMLGEEGAKKARKEMRDRGYEEEYIDLEIVADSLFDALSEKGLMKKISSETRMTVSEMLAYLADSLEYMLNRLTGSESWRKQLRTQRLNYKVLSQMFERGMDGAENDAKRASLVEDIRGEKRPTVIKKKNTEKRYSFKGYAEDGRSRYESNFPKGTPKTAKAETILKYIQNVWSKKPIRLKIVENGDVRYIYANFDPTYDKEGNVPTDASKLMGGNRHGTASDQRVTLDLADDYYQIATESTYNYSKDETGKDNPAHEGVLKWHYFINDIYFAEYGTEEYKPYRISINVKERADGDYVYSFSAEKTERLDTPRTLHAEVNNRENPVANVQSSKDNISQKKPKVKHSDGNSSDTSDENPTKRESKKKEPAKSLKAEDVFGKDYGTEYAEAKAEIERLRRQVALAEEAVASFPVTKEDTKQDTENDAEQKDDPKKEAGKLPTVVTKKNAEKRYALRKGAESVDISASLFSATKITSINSLYHRFYLFSMKSRKAR